MKLDISLLESLDGIYGVEISGLNIGFAMCILELSEPKKYAPVRNS